MMQREGGDQLTTTTAALSGTNDNKNQSNFAGWGNASIGNAMQTPQT